MNSKQLAILVALGVVLGGAGIMVRSRHASSFTESTSQMGGKILGEFDLGTVAGLRIIEGTNAVNITKTGDNWVVKERSGYPANFGNVAEFVRKLADLKVTKPVKVGPSSLGRLDLVAPDKGQSVLVELLSADGKTLRSLLLGRKVMKESAGDNSPMGGGGAWPVGRYVMVDNKPETVAVVSDPVSNAEPKAEDWIDKEFVKVEQPIFVSVTKPEATNSFTLSRTNEFGEWHMEGLLGDEKIDTSKVSVFSTLLSSASFSDVTLTPSADAFDKPSTIAVRTAGGFNYDVKLGKPGADDNYPIQVAVSADFPKERAAVKDEKKEDKDRLDKEFKDKLTKNEEKLKKEQALAKWTFTINKWSIDPLLKSRSELLAAKPGATNSAPTAPANAPNFGAPSLELPQQ
jgi:hypothetical protein